MQLLKRLQHFWRHRRFESDLAEEIRIHRDMAGGPAFGPEALVLEDSRAVWRFNWLDSLLLDVRYALRGICRAPGFALTVIATIGLALGLNTTLFTVFNAYVLRPFQVKDPYSLYRVIWAGDFMRRFDWPEFQDLRRQKSPFSDVLGTEAALAPVERRTSAVEMVTGNYFTMLGTGVWMGRPILESDSAPGSAPVTVISYDTWQGRFGGDPKILGTKLRLSGQAMEVVGVARPEFHGMAPMPMDFWVSLPLATALNAGSDLFSSQHPQRLLAIGRLNPGLSPGAAEAALTAWSRQVPAGRPGENRAPRITLQQQATPLPFRLGTAGFAPIALLFGLVLAIACANISNLMLARALTRQREMGIRVSLGAGRSRLVRQLLTESALLAIPAVAAGWAIGETALKAAQHILFSTAPPDFARMMHVLDLSPDLRVFGYLLLGGLAATLLFGLVPALQSTRSSLVTANRGDFSNDYRPSRLRNALVAVQVTVCSLLMIVTLVVMTSERNVLSQNHGLDTHQAFQLRIAKRFRAEAADRLRDEPLVETVASATRAPLTGGLPATKVVGPDGASGYIGFDIVSPEFFSVFRIKLVAGRNFTAQEAKSEAPVAIISEAGARFLWPSGNAIGQTIQLPLGLRDIYRPGIPAYRSVQVVGISKDTVNGWLGDGPRYECLYVPTTARPENESILVRVKGDPEAGRRAIEAAMERMAPSVVDFLLPMDQAAELQVYPFRLALGVTSFLGALALLLTVSGIYGVLSYLVSQRSKEIGIRIALGAGNGSVIGMVLKQSFRLAAIGAGVGVVLALGAAKLVAHEIEVVNPFEFVAYAGGVLMVLAATVGASWLPSRRAVRIDPATSLRCD